MKPSKRTAPLAVIQAGVCATRRTELLFRSAALALLLSALNPQLSTVFAQGNLTPPGAPAPTMKTLDQIEPRTPISSLPFTISAAGAYYVTTNLTGVNAASGITIAANDVTLDLKGYSLVGVAGSIDGIFVSGNRTNLIGNGTIRGWSAEGIDGTTAQASVFRDLIIIGSGDVGLRSGVAALVVRCAAIANSQEGILTFDHCQISQCAARNNGASGVSADINCRITDCRAASNNSDGISGGSGCSISGCTAASNVGVGIAAGTGSSINNCTTEANLSRGIDAGPASSVIHCAVVGVNYGAFTGHYGILVGDGSVVKGCSSRNNFGGGADISGIRAGNNCTLNGCAATTNSPYGIATGSNCVVLACSSSGNVPASSTGIATGQSSAVRGCSASGNYVGISVTASNTTVESCVVNGNGNVGISITADGCLILNNACEGNGAAGIECNASYNRIDGNHLANNSTRGIQVLSSASSMHNLVTRNSALTNSVQTIGYDVNAGTSDLGPIGKAATATNPWANLQ
jgi:parallel beta-helix repeat protein